MTKKERFIKFLENEVPGMDSFTVLTTIPGTNYLEEHKVLVEALDLKKEYYINAYDDDLININNPDVMIIAYHTNI